MKIGSNRDINRDRKNWPYRMCLKNSNPCSSTRPPTQSKNAYERHNDEKLAITLLIVGTGLIAYHFW